MPKLPKQITIHDLQDYIREMEIERGFTKETIVQKGLLLGEEVGELFKAIRKSENIKVATDSKFGNVEEELADILIYTIAIANKLNIDLEKAFREKEERNKIRKWE